MSEPLKPCPFPSCGGTLVRIEAVLRDGCKAGEPDALAYFVLCGNCGAQGPWFKSESAATRGWNHGRGKPPLRTAIDEDAAFAAALDAAERRAVPAVSAEDVKDALDNAYTDGTMGGQYSDVAHFLTARLASRAKEGAMKELDWTTAEDHLREVRRQYADIGAAGLLGLRITLDPLLLRYERGERTRELYAEIMATE